MTGTFVIHHFWHFCGQGIQIRWLQCSKLGIFSSYLQKMLKFSVLTNILTVYGKVTMLKHETIFNNDLLKNNISENNILFAICFVNYRDTKV